MVKKEKAEQATDKNVAGQQEAVKSAEELALEAQAQVFTPEQQTQIEALIAEAEKKGYGESQEEIERKEKVIKRLQGERSQKTTTREPTIPQDDSVLLQTVIDDMKAKEAEDGEVNPRRAILEQELVNRQRRTATAQFEAYKQDTIEKEDTALRQQITDAGGDPDDEQYDRVWDAFKLAKVDGDFSDAHKRVDRILKVKPKEKETKGELTEEEEDEIARKVLERRKGVGLKSETGGPSASGGRTFTREQIASMPIEEFEGLKPEIDKARKEGKIK